MTYTIFIQRDTATGTLREALAGVPEEMVQAAKDVARFATEAGDHITFQVTPEH